MQTKILKPHHEHDCEGCVLLGAFRRDDGVFDVYYCPESISLIGRTGDDGPDYHSLPISAAKAIAKERPTGVWGRIVAIYEGWLADANVFTRDVG